MHLFTDNRASLAIIVLIGFVVLSSSVSYVSLVSIFIVTIVISSIIVVPSGVQCISVATKFGFTQVGICRCQYKRSAR